MRSLTIDQARAVFALIRGDQSWRALLRVDALAFGVALLINFAIGFLYLAAQSRTHDAYGIVESLISLAAQFLAATIAIAMWRRIDLVRQALTASVWTDNIAAPLLLISFAQTLILPLRPDEQSISRAISVLLINLALIAVLAWVAFRVARTMLELSSFQAILFILVVAVLMHAMLVVTDLTFGTSIFLTPMIKAQIFW